MNERLTKKADRNDYYIPIKKGMLMAGYVDKLGQLEDIEEELGIDLITLFKALKNGIKDYDGGSKWYIALAYNQIRDEYFLYCDFGGGYSKTRDYNIECGWVLAKEI